MKREPILPSMVAALIPPGMVRQDVAAEKIHARASLCPYYDFTRNVAGSVAAVEQLLPVGAGAHDRGPGISNCCPCMMPMCLSTMDLVWGTEPIGGVR